MALINLKELKDKAAKVANKVKEKADELGVSDAVTKASDWTSQSAKDASKWTSQAANDASGWTLQALDNATSTISGTAKDVGASAISYATDIVTQLLKGVNLDSLIESVDKYGLEHGKDVSDTINFLKRLKDLQSNGPG